MPPRPLMPSFLTRYWFPLALIGLLFLAIPGAVLFALHLSGHDSALNQWFEKDYQLSYHLSIPWWGALILLLLPLAILILYFLKLKRKPLSVPSTFLWRKSIEDLHVNSLLQWLRQNVLLLLQLLVLVALIYGVMAFRFHGTGGTGKPYILMIDNSASMSATDVAPNRLEWAKQEALKEIDAHTDRDVGMVVVFNSSAEIRQSFTSNRVLLRDAVRRIEATQRTTRIEEALNLADSLANPVRSTENVASQPDNQEAGKERTYVPPKGTPTDVHLFSDGRFPDLSDAALANMNSRLAGNESALGSLNIQYHLAGIPGPDNVDNVGIVTFNALRDDTDASRVQVFVRVMNFRTSPVKPRVRLEVYEDGQLKNVYEQTLSLPGRKVVAATEANKEEANRREFPDASATFPLNGIDGRRQVMLYARLLDVTDKFPLDNEAWLVVSTPRKARVLYIGTYNEALDKFFSATEVEEVARVDQLTPKDLTEDTYRKAARNGTYDLVIFDRCAPVREEDMPRSNTFFIGYPPPPFKMDQAEKIVNPSITGWANNHPVLRDLRALYTIGIAEAFKVKWPPRTPALIEGRKITPKENTPLELLVALTRQSFTDLVLTFPIVGTDGKWNTDWWLQTSFPLFLRNILFTLGNLNENAIEETVQPGMMKKIRPDTPVQRITVVGPDDTEHALKHDERDPRTDFNFGATERVGVYRVQWDGGREQFAVNLLDPEESNIEPRPTFSIGSDQIEAGKQRGQPRELWKWFALLALGVLMVEWYVYNRRVYV